MAKKLFRTFATSLTDDELTLLDVMFDIPPDLLVDLFLKTQEVALRSQLRNIGVYVRNYESAQGEFPFHSLPNQSPELSWRVRILPYLGDTDFYKGLDLTQPKSSDSNRWTLLYAMPSIYGSGAETGLRWVQSDARRTADVTDGTSHTIAIIHNASPVPWTEDHPLTQVEAMKMFLALKPGESMIAIMYDGSLHKMTSDLKIQTFEALLTPDGGEDVDWNP